MAEQKEAASEIRCPHCGATDIALDVASGKLRCKYCRALFDGQATNAAGGVEELTGMTVGDGASNIIPDESAILTLKCASCGAEVVIDTNEATNARCHWCRHVLSVTDKLPNGAVPDVVLPFKIDKAVAEKNINEFVSKRKFFAHPKFKAEFSSENVMGVYLPYMIVDVNAHSKMSGEAEHLVKRYTSGSGNSQKTYYDADVYDVSREFDLLVDDLTIEASADKMNQNALVNTNNVINAIMPFDTENAVAWDARYLRGFASEKRDTNIEALAPHVQTQVEDVARYQMHKQMAEFYNRGAKWVNEQTVQKGSKWKAAYLPIWLYSYLEQNPQKGTKMLHYVAVNARTGETMGSIPINKGKLVAISVVIEIIGIILGTTWLITILKQDADDIRAALLGLLGYTPGFIYYWVKFNKYRNVSARHGFESETKAEVKNLVATDSMREHRKKLKDPRIAGENGRVVKGALSQGAPKMMGEKMASLFGAGLAKEPKAKKK